MLCIIKMIFKMLFNNILMQRLKIYAKDDDKFDSRDKHLEY